MILPNDLFESRMLSSFLQDLFFVLFFKLISVDFYFLKFEIQVIFCF